MKKEKEFNLSEMIYIADCGTHEILDPKDVKEFIRLIRFKVCGYIFPCVKSVKYSKCPGCQELDKLAGEKLIK